MKKSLLSIIGFAVLCFTSVAQIPNFSFENWTNLGTYENPVGWGTMNNFTKLASFYTATKATPGNPGNFYLKLTSKSFSTSVVNGVAVCGKLDTITMKPKSGFPYNSQPASFTGRWQHMIFGSTQGSVIAVLTKWNSGLSKRDTIAVAAQVLSGMAMSWTNFTINFAYKSSMLPDSCIIDLRASGNVPTNNDYLWVDNLAFMGSAAGFKEEASFLNYFLAYPNPSTEQVTLSLNLKSAQSVKIEMIDLTGKTVLVKEAGILNGESLQVINVSNIAKGIYFLRVAGGESIQTRKIIIE